MNNVMASYVSCRVLKGVKNVSTLRPIVSLSRSVVPYQLRLHSNEGKTPLKKPVTPVGKHDEDAECNRKWPTGQHPHAEKDPLEPWPQNVNPHTGEIGGPRGPEPTRYGDWERKGRCIDF